MAEEGFFSRWSRLKSDPGAAAREPQRPAAPAAPPAVPDHPSEVRASEQRGLPTLADVQRLGPDSDYSAFVARDVDAAVRRLALRKLFSDPHFNVRDGLDVYMGDYTRADPIPAAMLASLSHAGAWLGLGVSEADTEANPPEEAAPSASGAGRLPDHLNDAAPAHAARDNDEH